MAPVTETGSIDQLLAEDRLEDALAACVAGVKSAPGDAPLRMTLAELLCLSGQFERAEAQLSLLAQQDVAMPVAVARMRHLVRAALAREAWFTAAAVPALLSEPTALQRAAIALQLAIRAGDENAATAALDAAEGLRPVLSGEADGASFDDLRDLDDTSAFFLEVLTHDGGYIWVEWSQVAGLRFTPARRPIDLLWREARLALADGRVADIVVPAQYAGPGASPAHRLARRTDWVAGPGGVVTGRGQRCFLVGEEDRDILTLGEIRIRPAAPRP